MTDTSRQELIKLAKKGNLDSLSRLINDSLASRGVSAIVKRRNNCLQVILTSDKTINEGNLTQFIHNGVSKLNPPGIESIQVLGYRSNEEIPLWSQNISISKTDNSLPKGKKNIQPSRLLPSYRNFQCPFNIAQCNLRGAEINELDEEGKSKVFCKTCHYRYCTVTGKLNARYSRQNTVQRKTSKTGGVYKRDYELRILEPSGEINEICFEVNGKNDFVKVRKGDNVSILRTLNSDDIEVDTILVYNHTTQKNFVVGSPDSAAKSIALMASLIQGSLVTVGTFVIYFVALLFLAGILEYLGAFIFIIGIGLIVVPIFVGIRHGRAAYKTQFDKHSIKVKV